MRNAQLEIENESLKNELKNARADYAVIQADMTDVRDYYHQIDMAASKMGHRCEVLVVCSNGVCRFTLLSTSLVFKKTLS